MKKSLLTKSDSKRIFLSLAPEHRAALYDLGSLHKTKSFQDTIRKIILNAWSSKINNENHLHNGTDPETTTV